MLILILQYAAIGAVAGTFAGLLGVGGGIIIVPALAFVFGQQTNIIPADNLMHFVVGTSFAAIVPTTLSSLRAQLRRGNIDLSLFKQLVPGIIIGTAGGTILSSFLETHTLKAIFGIFMLIVSAQMFFGLGNGTPHHLNPISRWTGSLFVGTTSGLLGVSGGVLITPWLNYFNTPIRQAISAATACGVVISLTGTIGYIVTGIQESASTTWSTGYVFWPAVLAVAIFSPVFATLGVAVSHKLPVKVLKNIFAVFVFAVGLKMLF
jgi:uncharacterized membrane protein YfcA